MLIRRSSARFRGQRDYSLSTLREARPTTSRRVVGRSRQNPAKKLRREATRTAA